MQDFFIRLIGFLINLLDFFLHLVGRARRHGNELDQVTRLAQINP